MTTEAASDPRSGGVLMDTAGDVRLTRPGANVLAIMRILLGLTYLWAFFAQGFGIQYSNSEMDADGNPVSYGWHFDYDADAGWISSGFAHSPTEGYTGGAHGPTAFIVQDLPVGVDDFGWMFAIGGLGIALTFGIAMRIAGWGGFALNLLIWFAGFPPSSNPVIDAEHAIFAFALLLFMFLHAGNHWGFGRWWTSKTPAFLH
jgi:thiosulfate dehydrogenase [quinone] large subunit